MVRKLQRLSVVELMIIAYLSLPLTLIFPVWHLECSTTAISFTGICLSSHKLPEPVPQQSSCPLIHGFYLSNGCPSLCGMICYDLASFDIQLRAPK